VVRQARTGSSVTQTVGTGTDDRFSFLSDTTDTVSKIDLNVVCEELDPGLDAVTVPER